MKIEVAGTGSRLRLIAGSIIAALLVLAVSAGGAWAYFHDTETSSGNSFTAGTLDLVPLVTGTYTGLASHYYVTSGGNGLNGNVVFYHIVPGQSGTIEWILTNNGSIQGTLGISCTSAFTENGSAEPESLVTGNDGGGNGDLDQYLMVTLQKGTGTDQTAAEAALSYINGSTPWAVSGLAAILNAETQTIYASGGNDTVVYRLTWSLSGTDPNINIVQSDTAQMDVTFTLNQ